MTTHQASVDDAMVLGSLTAAVEEKARGSIRVDLGATTVDIPVALINGARRGPRVVITAGVHGGEFTGVDAANQLADALQPDEIRGQVIVCPVANPPAAYLGRLGVSPLDGVNINRVFPGRPDGGPTERLADWLFENLLAGADAYIDLHSGGIDETLCDFVGYRLGGDEAVDAKTRQMAHAAGFTDVIVAVNADGGNSHAAAVRRGVPAILVEKGQLGDRAADSARSLVDALRRLLHRLDVLDASAGDGRPDRPVREWVWAAGITAAAAGLWYPHFTAGDDVEDGQVIGRIVDPADGSEHLVSATATGRVFYGMHGLTVVPGAELAAIAARRAEAA
jgi:predicted deacylase